MSTTASARFYDDVEAAMALAEAMADLARLREQSRHYDYEIPPALGDDIRREANTIRAAVRFLCDGEDG